MKKLIILLAIAAMVLQAETVYFTPKSKTYCFARTCASLSRSTVILSAERSVAESHGLRHSNFERPKTTKAAKATNSFGKVVAK